MKSKGVPLNILLADDDFDDCIFFKEALKEFTTCPNLITVYDGEQLMRELNNVTSLLPDILFLDFNMPRKNGFECLREIKLNEKLKHLPVIMYSTSFQEDVVDLLYKSGAQYFIRKPSVFSQFKKIIQQAIVLVAHKNIIQPERENFVLIAEDNFEVPLSSNEF